MWRSLRYECCTPRRGCVALPGTAVRPFSAEEGKGQQLAKDACLQESRNRPGEESGFRLECAVWPQMQVTGFHPLVDTGCPRAPRKGGTVESFESDLKSCTFHVLTFPLRHLRTAPWWRPLWVCVLHQDAPARGCLPQPFSLSPPPETAHVRTHVHGLSLGPAADPVLGAPQGDLSEISKGTSQGPCRFLGHREP